ncbi:MAG: CAP domain-containing protein, partial [Halobacteriaceae archaeon]
WVTRSVPAVQLRRTIVGPKLVVVVVAASLVLSGATAGLTVGAMQKSIAGLTAEDTTLGGDLGPRAGQGPNATGTPSHSPAQTTRTRSADDAGLNRTKIELLVHKFVNQERRERGLEPLDFDQQLQKIARYHSRDMATHRYFAHTAPDGETMGDRYEKFGYSCRISIGDNRYMTGAENIAYTYAYATIDTKWGEVSYNGNETQIARGLVKQWMHSPGHRKNILKPYWENEGIGVYIIEVGSKTRVYATQNFC